MKNNFLWIAISLVLTTILGACAGASPLAAASAPQAPAVASVASAPVTPVPADGAAPTRQISVTGTGKVFITPDVAYVNIGVHSEADTVTAALAQNNDQAQGVSTALKNLGVDAKDIQTSAFNVYPQQQNGPNGNVEKTVYVVDNTVYVTVRDLSKLGQLLDAVTKAGANSINGIQFDASNKSQALAQAREMAIQDARTQADELTKAAGVTLGPIDTISLSSGNQPQPMFAAPAAMSAGANVPVSAGQLEISIDASITYEIK
ncbi:MAG TPA: SIMPL domain-containing protein [Anaerolineaceae bacterium]|nr:SIMPL domain-containing protein [Anaerolineaceae bacterium]